MFSLKYKSLHGKLSLNKTEQYLYIKVNNHNGIIVCVQYI